MGTTKQRSRAVGVPAVGDRGSVVSSLPHSVSSVLRETFSTGLGWIALARQGDVIQGLVMGHSSDKQAEAALIRLLGRSQLSKRAASEGELSDELRRFADGEPIDFAHVVINERHLAPFARRVTAACRRIGWGQTRSYGQLAAECGSPRAARAVGQVMANNRFPLIVPCHRVLAAGGRLGGFSAPQGLRLKSRLLALECDSFSSAAKSEFA